MAESIPLFDKGDNVTGVATAAVTGARFLRISAARTVAPVTSLTGYHQMFSVAHAGAGNAPVGISMHDAATGETVGIHHQPAIITEVEAGAALTSGTLVMSDATGRAVPYVAGAGVFAAGTCLDDAATGAKALIDRSAR
jgi:hypothetical protein